jgi:alpha-1,3-rhamnosyl/mannosyltransferase
VLRVGYEVTVLQLDRGGTARAVLALRDALRETGEVHLEELAHPPGRGGRLVRGLARELWDLPVRLPRRVALAGVDLLHCPSPLVPVRSPGVPLVVNVNDVLPWAHPKWMGRANVLQHRLVLERVLRSAAAVVTPSTFTRDELVRRLGIDPDRVTVTPYGIDPRFSPRPEPAEPPAEPYLLAVGTLQPRKDIETAVAAFERLADAGAPHSLLVVGRRGWRDDELMARLQRSRYIERIRVAGRVSDDDLIAMYRDAACLLFPSRYEGFGFPALEAMACGTPVVAAAATSLVEVVGDAGMLVPPGDVDGFAAAASRILEDPDEAARLASAGLARARTFTWEACARATIETYRRTLAR